MIHTTHSSMLAYAMEYKSIVYKLSRFSSQVTKNLNSFLVHFCSRRRTLQDVLMLWYDLCSATDILIIVILTISSSHWVFSEHIVVLWWNLIQLNRAQSSIQKFERTVITLRKYIHNYISTYFLYCHCFTSEIFAFKRRYNWTNKCPFICGLCSLKHHTMI